MKELLSLSLFCLFLISCSPETDYTGTYRTMDGRDNVIELELKANGQGQWTGDMDTFPLQWETRNREIWLHTRTGGVIRGKVSNGELTFELPGNGTLRFYKSDR